MALIIAQINPTIGDFSGNLKRMAGLAGQCEAGDAVFFALGSISGYLQHMPDQDFLAQGMLGLTELAGRLPHLSMGSAYWNIDGLPTIFISQQGHIRHIPQPRAHMRHENQNIALSLTPPEDIVDEDVFVYLHPLAFNLVPMRQNGLPAGYIHGCANLVGGQDGLVFEGLSKWLMPDGRELNAPAWQEGRIISGSPADENFLPDNDPFKRLHQALLLGIADYVGKNGFSSVILGLSGGVDSALVALLAVQALGAERVLALSMPSPYSSSGAMDDARILAANLGINLHEVPIEPLMNQFNLALAGLMGSAPPGVEQENLQARIRALLLMVLANRYNHLLLATSNRSESLVGYTTLYGDMSGGLAPIADLYKTEVYALCEYLDPENRIIPRSIITRAPSAELKPNQTDQDSLPPYPLLDMILQQISEDGLSGSSLLRQGVDKMALDKTIALMAASQFKREQAPPRLNLRGALMSLPLTGVRKYILP